MKKISWFLILSLSFYCCEVLAQLQNDTAFIRKIYNYSLTESGSYENLRYLCKNIGNRLSGSANAEKAVKWAEKQMKEYGPDEVYLQDVMVPNWKRGQESFTLNTGTRLVKLAICALGGSVSTPDNLPLKGRIVEVSTFEELAALGSEKLKNKIVFINHKMNRTNINTFDSYGENGKYRWGGAVEASKYGACAVIVRSLTLANDNAPHTGGFSYKNASVKIPAAAISAESADKLSALLKEHTESFGELLLTCATQEDVISYNVIAEIKGSLYPDEIIVVGGHLDSWDKGEGAHDDGAGIVQTMELIKAFKTLGYKPQRTIRIVAFMNEENGLRGGKKYAEIALARKEKTICALESDAGGFSPRGFTFEGDSLKSIKVKSFAPLFFPYGVYDFGEVGGGADIGPLKDQGALLIELLPDSQRYFDLHHTDNDVFEQVNKRELELGSATIISLIYLIDKYGF